MIDLVYSFALLAAAWEDLKSREVSLFLCLMMAFIGMVAAGLNFLTEVAGSAIFFSSDKIMYKIAALTPGAVLLVLSRVSRGAVGEGDGWFFLGTGLCLGCEKTFLLLAGGILLCGLFSLPVLVMGYVYGKNRRKMEVPFLPFLVPVWFCMNMGRFL